MFENIAIFLLVAIFIAIALMNIEGARTIGKSILASAGVIGILVGLAAQKSMGQILSGIQIALTQPVKINDFVNINGELGQIEEITLTYIVVKIWDDRRLVVPIDYFLNNPVENWTNKTSEIVGKIYFYVAYSLPLEPIRKKLSSILEGDPNWDGRVQRVQVTDCRELVKEVRISVSSSNISDNFALRLKVREEIIDFINSEYPDALGILQFENIKSISN
jgi:small-conductance mechanosensitive channel